MSDPKTPAEGWYQDPYGSHEARWFSEGVPTALVRDGAVEGHDPPPVSAGSASLDPEELPEQTTGPGDLLRADDAETDGGDHRRTPADAALDAFPRSATLG
jgi:hypothetical protein